MHPVDALRAYAEEHASLHEVMRALVAHRGWLAPAGFVHATTGADTFDTVVLAGASFDGPAEELWLFTDRAHLDQVVGQGVQLGAYVPDRAGWDLFGRLGGYACTKVNIGGDPSEFWYLDESAVGLCRMWTDALVVEAWLAQPDSSARRQALSAYPAYTVLIIPEQQAVATAVGAGGLSNPAMVFTAPDASDRVLAQVPGLRAEVVSGGQLFSVIEHQGVDGIIINPLGPTAPVAMTLADCALVRDIATAPG